MAFAAPTSSIRFAKRASLRISLPFVEPILCIIANEWSQLKAAGAGFPIELQRTHWRSDVSHNRLLDFVGDIHQLDLRKGKILCSFTTGCGHEWLQVIGFRLRRRGASICHSIYSRSQWTSTDAGSDHPRPPHWEARAASMLCLEGSLFFYHATLVLHLNVVSPITLNKWQIWHR